MNERTINFSKDIHLNKSRRKDFKYVLAFKVSLV